MLHYLLPPPDREEPEDEELREDEELLRDELPEE